MDIPRESRAGLRLIKRILIGLVVVGALGGGYWYTSRLKPAAPSVERARVYIETVKRGTIPRQVRGLGKLVPEEIRLVPAATEGRVEKKLLEAGAYVTPDTVLFELSNQQLEQEMVNAEWDWKAQQSSHAELRARLEKDQLTQITELAKTESDAEQAKLKYEASRELFRSGLISSLDLKRDEANALQLANRVLMEKKGQEIFKENVAAQLAESRTRIDQNHARYVLKKSEYDQLKVRAGVEGVLQELSVQVGQRVGTGTNLARVANPNKLKAELDIPETQAKDVQLGQEVSIDTRNGLIPGKVSRIDPAVKNGTVTVDVRLMGDLPKGARPDLSVDGTIVLERLIDIIYVGHPAQGQPNSQMSLFKLDADGNGAERTTVKLGRSSVNLIEVKEGLKPGDQVILSDMPEYDSADRIRLN